MFSNEELNNKNFVDLFPLQYNIIMLVYINAF